MSGRVEIVTSVILADGTDPVPGPVAWRRGSILWRDSKKVRLHGDATQFPMEVVDFEAHGIDPAAPWFVQMHSDLTMPVLGSVQLLINRRFPRVVDALQNVSSTDPTDVAIRSILTTDVGRTLVEHLLSLEDETQDWPEESLGHVLRQLAASRFGSDARSLRGRRESDAAGWAVDNAASFRLLAGVGR
jgi:hypothetical protein